MDIVRARVGGPNPLSVKCPIAAARLITERAEPYRAAAAYECTIRRYGMPRRRDPIKSREVSTLVRDARPTWREIKGEPNLRKRRERIARAKSAREALMKMNR